MVSEFLLRKKGEGWTFNPGLANPWPYAGGQGVLKGGMNDKKEEANT